VALLSFLIDEVGWEMNAVSLRNRRTPSSRSYFDSRVTCRKVFFFASIIRRFSTSEDSVPSELAGFFLFHP